MPKEAAMTGAGKMVGVAHKFIRGLWCGGPASRPEEWGWVRERGRPARRVKPISLEPAGHLGKGVRGAVIGGHEHVDGKDERKGRSGAVFIGRELGDGDDAARRQGIEDFLQEEARAGFALAVENMAQGGEVVARAEILGKDVAFDDP